MRSLLVAGIFMLATTPALAESRTEIDACRTAVKDAASANMSEPSVEFKSIKGASLKKISFDVSTTTDKTVAVCKIKRGKVIEIDW